MLNILAIETNNGVYLQSESDRKSKAWNSNNNSELLRYKFDGVEAELSFEKDWVFVKQMPKVITRDKPAQAINQRYEIVDESLISERLPKSFPYSESEKYEGVGGLYRYVDEKIPGGEENIDFNIKTILKIDNLPNYTPFSFTYGKEYVGSFYSDKGWRDLKITHKAAEFQEIDKILFPSIMLPSRPCQLTSEQSYNIIRAYVKENIDPKNAEITSDYNFHFEVKKKIKLNKSYNHTWEKKTPTGRSYKRPQYNTKLVTHKSVSAYNISHSNARDKFGGVVVEGFKGENSEDLKKNIDNFLEELISYINTPLKECECCNGVGVLENK